MSSEARRAGDSPTAVAFHGIAASATARPAWPAVERRVLLNKLEDLEERARRLDYLETRLRDLSHEVKLLNRLTEATHALHSATDTSQLLDIALAECLDVLHADTASILLYQSDTRELVIAKARAGGLPMPLEGAKIPVGQGVAGYVALHRQPLHIVDIEQDGRFPVRDSGRYATKSFLCVPVAAREDLLGVLNVTDRCDRHPFAADDLRTAQLLAKELAAAIERVRRLEASQDMHRQFVSKLAHELRNPLDGVLRFINLTLTDQHPEERRRHYLLASKQGIERLTGIVRSLTGMYRQARPSDEPCDANALVHEAVQLQEEKAEQRGIRVSPCLQDGLPPVGGGSGLFQVFTNLISNAYDAMEQGGGTLSITSCREDGMVVVRFADTGCGMPPEVVQRLFTPFFTTKQPGKGMGLGLAVCREVVERLRGRIEVASEPGKGTTFTVAVPCVRIEGAIRL